MRSRTPSCSSSPTTASINSKRAALFGATAGAVVLLAAAPASAHPLHASTAPVSWSAVLGRSALGAALLWATLPLAGLLCASLWADRSPRLEAPLLDAALGMALVAAVALLRDGRGLGVLGFALIVLHLTAAAVWLGGVLELVMRRSQRREVARRFGPVGLASLCVLVATGLWNVRLHTGGKPLAGDYEHVLGVKLALVAGAVGVAAVARARMRAPGEAPSRRLIGGEAGLLATAVAVAAVLTALPAAAAGGPMVRVIASGIRVVVRSGGRTFTASGPDAAECASHASGVLLAGGDPRRLSCSTNGLYAPEFGAAFARFLAGKAVRSTVVVADDSARSQAMTEAFVRTARAEGVGVDAVRTASDIRSWGDAALITSGWSTAREALDAIASSASPPIRGAFLAPWLLTSTVTGNPGRVQLSVGLPFDPSEFSVGVYLTEVATRARGAAPSAAGLEGWLEARGARRGNPTAIQFFTPARIDILPPSLEAGHGHAGRDWVSGGQMAAVSGLVRLDG